MKDKIQRKKIIEYLNYKDILIILSSWYFMAILLIIIKGLNFDHSLLTNIFHFLFLISGRFIFFSLSIFYLTSLYPIEFKDLGINFNCIGKQLKYSLAKIFLLFILVITIINIPVSFMSQVEFSPLFKITGPDAFISSLFPFILLLAACLFIALAEQLILNIIIFELFRHTLFNSFFALIFTSLLYSIIIVEITPARILLNTIISSICILLYRKEKSIIPSSFFMAAYYSIYISYIYGFNFIKF